MINCSRFFGYYFYFVDKCECERSGNAVPTIKEMYSSIRGFCWVGFSLIIFKRCFDAVYYDIQSSLFLISNKGGINLVYNDTIYDVLNLVRFNLEGNQNRLHFNI